jgi:hypothetical protein
MAGIRINLVPPASGPGEIDGELRGAPPLRVTPPPPRRLYGILDRAEIRSLPVRAIEEAIGFVEKGGRETRESVAP